MRPFNPNHRDGKEWCGQCERLNSAAGARACKSQWCKLKALLPLEADSSFDSSLVRAPADAVAAIRKVEVHPAIVSRFKEPAFKKPKVPKPKGRPGRKPDRDADGLTPSARRLFNAMLERADGAGKLTVSYAELHEGVCSPTSVAPLMKNLLESKLVVLIARKAKGKSTYLIPSEAA